MSNHPTPQTRNGEPRFTKQGPKRRRRTRRELPYGGISLWALTETHFKREREAAYIRFLVTTQEV